LICKHSQRCSAFLNVRQTLNTKYISCGKSKHHGLSVSIIKKTRCYSSYNTSWRILHHPNKSSDAQVAHVKNLPSYIGLSLNNFDKSSHAQVVINTIVFNLHVCMLYLCYVISFDFVRNLTWNMILHQPYSYSSISIPLLNFCTWQVPPIATLQVPTFTIKI
jgi:hypothetical protein